MSKREIKFRAWDGDKMRYNVLAGHGDYVAEHEDDSIWWWHEPPKAIMQFTGLLDKNGKEIYEGDIVEAKNWNPMCYTVEFIEGGFCFTHPKLKGSPIDINLMFSSQGCACAVIGNVHENPELLLP